MRRQGRLELGQPRLGVAEFGLKVEQASLLAGDRVAQASWIDEWPRHYRCHCSTRAGFEIAARVAAGCTRVG